MGTRRVSLILLLLIGQPALANHDWFGQDLCRSFPERMPPGIAPNHLPDPTSPGAALLADHCAQCHQLPGPGHHTAAEWLPIVQNMQLLAQVTARFGGRPELSILSADQRQTLADYLQRHALRPLPPSLTAPQAYLTACGDCHAAPDPALHTAAEWPGVFARMAGLRPRMSRPPLDPLTATQALSFLSDHAAPTLDAPRNIGRWVALAPVALLLLLALWVLARALLRKPYRSHAPRPVAASPVRATRRRASQAAFPRGAWERGRKASPLDSP